MFKIEPFCLYSCRLFVSSTLASFPSQGQHWEDDDDDDDDGNLQLSVSASPANGNGDLLGYCLAATPLAHHPSHAYLHSCPTADLAEIC